MSELNDEAAHSGGSGPDRPSGPGRSAAAAGFLMAVGTLTVLPVRVRRTDRPVAAWAMSLGPAVGVLIAALGGAVLLGAMSLNLSSLLVAAAGLGALALLTRGLHLDGLADLADGLGSARPAEESLDIMRRSDIGPFGVVTLLFTLLIQVAALAQLVEDGPVEMLAGLAAAVLAGRLAIAWACTPGTPAARPGGLGAAVAGAVPKWAPVVATVLVLLLTPLLGLVGPVYAALPYAAAVLVALLVSYAFKWHAVRRLNGITGDVLGALCEIATTVALVVAASGTATISGAGS